MVFEKYLYTEKIKKIPQYSFWSIVKYVWDKQYRTVYTKQWRVFSQIETLGYPSDSCFLVD